MGPAYVYLLGLYLGDGMLWKQHHDVWRLRIFQSSRYVELIDRCKAAIYAVSARTTCQSAREGCTEIVSHWQHWICLFPQHGAGPKHQRRITLEEWQHCLVERYPAELVAGLVHSDGCRAMNVVYRPGRDGPKRYEYPRYFFTNHSDDIRNLFRWACGLIGVESRPNNRWNISVARRKSVEILDSFIGPKR